MQPKLLLIAGGAALGLATPAAAQMDHSNMPGMKMPAPKAPAVKKPVAKKAAAAKPVARKAPAKPAARSTPRTRVGSAAKPAASRSAKPPVGEPVVAVVGAAQPTIRRDHQHRGGLHRARLKQGQRGVVADELRVWLVELARNLLGAHFVLSFELCPHRIRNSAKTRGVCVA